MKLVMGKYKDMKLASTLCFTIVICLIWMNLASPLPNPLLQILDSLSRLEGLPQSLHLAKCFSAQDDGLADTMIRGIIKSGAQSASSTLPSLPAKIVKAVVGNLQQSTIGCLSGSNDMQVLRHRLGLGSNWEEKFSAYSKENFLSVHYSFSNMSELVRREAEEKRWGQVSKVIKRLCEEMRGGDEKLGGEEWRLRAEQVEKMSEYFGVAVSNGVIGVVSANKPFKASSTVLGGVYDKIGRGRVDNLVETFPGIDFHIEFNGASDYYNYVQEVQMQTGSMTHSFSGSSYSLTYTYYTLRNLPFVIFTQIAVTAHTDGSICAKSIHHSPAHLLKADKDYEQIDTSKKVYSIMSTEAWTKTGKVSLAIASGFLFGDGDGNSVLHEDWDSEMHLQKFTRKLKKGQTYQFGIVTSLFSSAHNEDPKNEAIRMVIRASSLTSLLSGHIQAWSRLWESDIIIDGHPQDQKLLRSMLYHCYSFLNEDAAYGVSPMGLSGLGYNGHVFWDMDLWIYPAILALRPSLAKKMLDYRVARLPAAKHNAFINGYKGAMYPWESSSTGAEQTPVWALSGTMEHHIGGCVALAAWSYFQVTQDLVWLREEGFELIEQVAQFYASRVEVDGEGKFHIRNVVGADEWAEDVDDDAFTNGVASFSLRIANEAARRLNYSESALWDKISKNIVLLKFETNVTKEHSTYAGEHIKQADVNLLAFPLKTITNASQVAADLSFYETRVPDAGTPAMTYSIFTLLYSRLRNPEKAYQYFRQSFQEFLKPPFNVFSQTKGGVNPYFLTGAGGVLQSVIYGFGGLDITEAGIIQIPSSIPKQWSRLTIKREVVRGIIKDEKAQ